jgi:hypothetical protein
VGNELFIFLQIIFFCKKIAKNNTCNFTTTNSFGAVSAEMASDWVQIKCHLCTSLNQLSYHQKTGMYSIVQPNNIQNVIDISCEHDTFQQSEVYTILSSFNNKGNIYNHHLIGHSPFLIIPTLTTEQLIEISTLNYDWHKYAEYIVKSTILSKETSSLKDFFYILSTYLNIDYTAYKLDLPSTNLQYFLIKLPTLIELGFCLNYGFVNKYYDIIFESDDDVIQILIDNGYDVENSIKNNPSTLKDMSCEAIDKLLKFFGQATNPEFISECILKSLPQIEIFKYLVKTHGVDMSAVIADLN